MSSRIWESNEAIPDLLPADVEDNCRALHLPDGIDNPLHVVTSRVYFDGLNLALGRGTGITTYTRTLTELLRADGWEVGAVFSSPERLARASGERSLTLFEETHFPRTPWRRRREDAVDHLRYRLACRPVQLSPEQMRVAANATERLPALDRVYAARNLFKNARRYFQWTGRLAILSFDVQPDIFHCTYPMALAANGALNLFTIHDLVPLRLAGTTTDDRKEMLRLLTRIARQADHIVTVSEHSRRDIIELLGADESRVTNLYQAVSIPQEWREVPERRLADRLGTEFALDYRGYLLFFGAIEPKKNVARLIEAYLASDVSIPLVIVSSGGWQNQKELALIRGAQEQSGGNRRRVIHLEYLPRELLVMLVRGARGVVFPSLYEGFGLPVAEAMTLGTPVITSNVSSLPEIAGDAALLVDPLDTDSIADAIRKLAADDDLCRELTRRGTDRAALFAPERYSARVRSFYASLLGHRGA